MPDIELTCEEVCIVCNLSLDAFVYTLITNYADHAEVALIREHNTLNSFEDNKRLYCNDSIPHVESIPYAVWAFLLLRIQIKAPSVTALT